MVDVYLLVLKLCGEASGDSLEDRNEGDGPPSIAEDIIIRYLSFIHHHYYYNDDFNRNFWGDGTWTPSHSLVEQIVPVGSHEVPDQGLPQRVGRDAVDHSGGVLFTHFQRVQTVLQIPGKQRGQGSN